MASPHASKLGAPVIAALLVLTLTPLARAAEPAAVDITPQFSAVTVDEFQAFEVGGIVILRGRTLDKLQAEEASRIAQTLGYTRVANLIQVTPPADDDANRDGRAVRQSGRVRAARQGPLDRLHAGAHLGRRRLLDGAQAGRLDLEPLEERRSLRRPTSETCSGLVPEEKTPELRISCARLRSPFSSWARVRQTPGGFAYEGEYPGEG